MHQTIVVSYISGLRSSTRSSIGKHRPPPPLRSCLQLSIPQPKFLSEAGSAGVDLNYLVRNHSMSDLKLSALPECAKDDSHTKFCSLASSPSGACSVVLHTLARVVLRDDSFVRAHMLALFHQDVFDCWSSAV